AELRGSLLHFALANCKKITNEGVQTILTQCPELNNVAIVQIPIGDEAFDRITSTQITSWSVSLTNVTDNFIKKIKQFCPLTEELHCYSISISGNAIKEALEGFPKLHTLNIA